jgi:hypothetical protein
MQLPIADWTAALDRMTQSLDHAIADLTRYQAEWAPVVETPAVATHPEMLLAWLERRLTQWDARLAASAELAANVERQLDEREAAVGRWHEVFVKWRELIQQGVGTSNTSAVVSRE